MHGSTVVDIDRRNSAEITEAINSMYKIYANATECYLYLHDVTGLHLDTDGIYEDINLLHQRLGVASWFLRGWTLQELLALKVVVFLDRYWHVIVHKCSIGCPCASQHEVSRQMYGPNLNDILSTITRIPLDFLSHRMDIIEDASVAAKLSWTIWRETTRPEDEAYSLQGMFDVKVPANYGDGRQKSFHELQKALLRKSKDQSIFAWTVPRQLERWPRTHFYAHSRLAPNKWAFVSSTDIVQDSGGMIEYTLLNSGIRIRAHAWQLSWHHNRRPIFVYIVKLVCTRRGPKGSRLPVEIAITDGTTRDEPSPSSTFFRIFANDLGPSIQEAFPPARRPDAREYVFTVSARHDHIFEVTAQPEI